jgi:hypothetical protein
MICGIGAENSLPVILFVTSVIYPKNPSRTIIQPMTNEKQSSPAIEELRYIWPDLTIDQIAYNSAKMALPTSASLSEILRKAQEIKEFLGA